LDDKGRRNFYSSLNIVRAMAGRLDEPASNTYGRKEKDIQDFGGEDHERDFNIQKWLKIWGWEIVEWIRVAELRSSSSLS